MQRDPFKISNTLLHTCPLTIWVLSTAATNPVAQDAPEISSLWVPKSQWQGSCLNSMEDSGAGHRLSSHLKMLWEFWRLERYWGQRGRWLLVRCREKGSDAELEEAVKQQLGVELREAASDLPAMSHTNHEATWNISPTHTSPLSLTSSLSFVVILLFCFLSSHTLHCFPASSSHFGIFLLLSSHYILQIFHILEKLQAVLLSFGHCIFGLYDDTVLNCFSKKLLVKRTKLFF